MVLIQYSLIWHYHQHQLDLMWGEKENHREEKAGIWADMQGSSFIHAHYPANSSRLLQQLDSNMC